MATKDKKVLVFAGAMVVLFGLARFFDTFTYDPEGIKKEAEQEEIARKQKLLQVSREIEQFKKDSIAAIKKNRDEEISNLKSEVYSVSQKLKNLSSANWQYSSFGENGNVNLTSYTQNYATTTYEFAITSVKVTPTESGIVVICASGNCISAGAGGQEAIKQGRLQVYNYDEVYSNLLKKYQSLVKELLLK